MATNETIDEQGNSGGLGQKLLSGILAKYGLFSGMNEAQVAEAARVIRMRKYPAGEAIWQEGEEGNDVILLLEGEVEITQRLTLFSGEEAHTHDKALIKLNADMRPVIGEIALCANTPRSAAVIAKSDITVGVFTMHDLTSIIDKDPHFGYLLYKNLASVTAQRLITANQNVLKLTTAFSLALERGT